MLYCCLIETLIRPSKDWAEKLPLAPTVSFVWASAWSSAMVSATTASSAARSFWNLTRILRTDYGQLEAISVQGSDPRIYETTVKRILTDERNHITGAETVKLRRTAEGKMEPIAGSEQTLECGLMLIAAGFVGCDGKTLENLSLTADGRGRLMPEDASHYLGGKLFSAGDMRTGQSLVVRALADGRAAALEADALLRRA